LAVVKPSKMILPSNITLLRQGEREAHPKQVGFSVFGASDGVLESGYLPNLALRTGAGIGSPGFNAAQRIALSLSGSARS